MREDRDPRESALADLEALLDALDLAREPDVVVRPGGSTSHEWNVVLPQDRELRRLKRQALRQRLLAMTIWAEVRIYEDSARGSKFDRLRWPEPVGLFPSEPPASVEILVCPYPREGIADEGEGPAPEFGQQAASSLARILGSLPIALDILALFTDVSQRLTSTQIADNLSLAGRGVKRTKLIGMLSDLVKVGWLTNGRDQRGSGYYPTEDGLAQIEQARELEDE